MKLFLSADIEGVAGITSWQEANPDNVASYRPFQERMTDEVRAACVGALEAGVTEICVRDAHWHGRNLLHERLPKEVRLVRGWSRHPYMMVQEIDATFDAVGFVGYHSKGGSGGNPMAHTLTSSVFQSVSINRQTVSEFHLYAGASALEGVPAVFVSGDQTLCDELSLELPGIETVATLTGHGLSTISLHPSESCQRIQAGMKRALLRLPQTRDSLRKRPAPPFDVEIVYNQAVDAYRNSFYPGAMLRSDRVVGFVTDSFFDVLRLLAFASLKAPTS